MASEGPTGQSNCCCRLQRSFLILTDQNFVSARVITPPLFAALLEVGRHEGSSIFRCRENICFGQLTVVLPKRNVSTGVCIRIEVVVCRVSFNVRVRLGQRGDDKCAHQHCRSTRGDHRLVAFENTADARRRLWRQPLFNTPVGQCSQNDCDDEDNHGSPDAGGRLVFDVQVEDEHRPVPQVDAIGPVGKPPHGG